MRVTRWAILVTAIFLMVHSAGAQTRLALDRSPFPPTYVPSGEHLYKQYCSACHGADATGHGPAASSLKMPPADLTTLAKRHLGKFPAEYVSAVLLFGPGASAHGSSDMPTWGPVFMYLDKHDEAAVRQRIKNLSDYLESLQEK